MLLERDIAVLPCACLLAESVSTKPQASPAILHTQMIVPTHLRPYKATASATHGLQPTNPVSLPLFFPLSLHSAIPSFYSIAPQAPFQPDDSEVEVGGGP